MRLTVLALPLGFLLDLLLGDPHGWPHPVIWIGKLISLLEKGLRRAFPKTPAGEKPLGPSSGSSPPGSPCCCLC